MKLSTYGTDLQTNENSLDTGSGKTLIACLLIRHVLEDEVIRRATGSEPKFVFFIANRSVIKGCVGIVLTFSACIW